MKSMSVIVISTFAALAILGCPGYESVQESPHRYVIAESSDDVHVWFVEDVYQCYEMHDDLVAEAGDDAVVYTYFTPTGDHEVFRTCVTIVMWETD